MDVTIVKNKKEDRFSAIGPNFLVFGDTMEELDNKIKEVINATNCIRILTDITNGLKVEDAFKNVKNNTINYTYL